MIKPSDPRQLAIDLLARSICAVQVAAVLADDSGIFSWGWNSVGSGYGEHAECAAIRRANKERLECATIYVAAQRKRNGKTVLSKPCEDCKKRIIAANIYLVYYRLASGKWEVVDRDFV
jgi:deoxycytidylate deaminase